MHKSDTVHRILKFVTNQVVFYAFITVYGLALVAVCSIDRHNVEQDTNRVIEDSWPAFVLLMDNLVCTVMIYLALYKIKQ